MRHDADLKLENMAKMCYNSININGGQGMLSVGDTVVYGTQGVCRIKEISMMKFGKTKAEYYVLAPVADEHSAVYVPTTNQKLLAKMRELISREELDALIDSANENQIEWISDDNGRKNYCDEVVKNGTRQELMQLIGMLYNRREMLKNEKKHFHNVDAQYLKTAERLLHDEFAYILGISAEEVPQYIIQRIEK